MSDHAFPDLEPDERELAAVIGQDASGRFRDPVDERILWLTSRRLERVAATSDGWDQLYRDTRDGRYWELTFPQGSLHGGGPRRLTAIEREDAEAKYAIASRG
jgi:hypothetical protein